MMTKKESATKRWIRVIEGEGVMPKSEMPKFVMFNTRTWEVVARGDDEEVLLSMYHGKNYQIAKTKPLGEREEW